MSQKDTKGDKNVIPAEAGIQIKGNGFPLTTCGNDGLRLGFTLIEVMIVLFIIGILTALIAPRLIGRTDDARVSQAKVQIKNFDTALKLYKMDNGFYPSTAQGLEALIIKPSAGQVPKNYRAGGYLDKKKMPADPWGNQYAYISPGTQGDYDIISYGADGAPGGEGYNADISNWDL
ncbi:MAG: type II secretion system major pseudopilin GspG [Nitrospirae bacterium]|nr:type II secretion system major pseudopilin GspG [Nitrospirota bacterium]